MRVLTLFAVTLLTAAPAGADGQGDGRLNWPLRPPPAVVRDFDAPSPICNRGHRGVDLAGAEQLLEAHQGRLREIIGDPPGVTTP